MAWRPGWACSRPVSADGRDRSQPVAALGEQGPGRGGSTTSACSPARTAALAPGEPPLAPAAAREAWTWPANDEAPERCAARAWPSTAVSAGRALIVTEGGYGVLYAAGAALASRGGDDDDLIARAWPRARRRVQPRPAGHRRCRRRR